MGMAIGALGSLAGGALGGMLVPKPEPIKADTRIPGILNATVQKGGKKNQEVNAAQANPDAILPYYEKAAKKFDEKAMEGLGLYNDAIQKAVDLTQESYKQGSAATNQYMKMLGFDPPDGSEQTPAQRLQNIRNIKSQMEEMPGYQFQLSQGMQGIERAARAGGMLGSGNTLMAANDYAQNQAQGYYSTYLNSLQPIMAQQTNAFNALNQLYGNIGVAALNTYTNIGKAYNDAYTNQGNTMATVTMFNAQQQNDAMTQARQIQAGKEITGQQAGIQAAQLGLANSQFNYQVAQNQQAGMAAYNAMSGGGRSTYTAGGMSFPDYTGRGWGGDATWMGSGSV